MRIPSGKQKILELERMTMLDVKSSWKVLYKAPRN